MGAIGSTPRNGDILQDEPAIPVPAGLMPNMSFSRGDAPPNSDSEPSPSALESQSDSATEDDAVSSPAALKWIGLSTSSEVRRFVML